MVSPEIMTNLGPWGENPQRPETGRQQPQPSTQGKHNNNTSFPYRDYRYHDQPRQTQFNEKQNQMYSPYHFAPFTCTLCRLQLAQSLYNATG